MKYKINLKTKSIPSDHGICQSCPEGVLCA